MGTIDWFYKCEFLWRVRWGDAHSLLSSWFPLQPPLKKQSSLLELSIHQGKHYNKHHTVFLRQTLQQIPHCVPFSSSVQRTTLGSEILIYKWTPKSSKGALSVSKGLPVSMFLRNMRQTSHMGDILPGTPACRSGRERRDLPVQPWVTEIRPMEPRGDKAPAQVEAQNHWQTRSSWKAALWGHFFLNVTSPLLMSEFSGYYLMPWKRDRRRSSLRESKIWWERWVGLRQAP